MHILEATVEDLGMWEVEIIMDSEKGKIFHIDPETHKKKEYDLNKGTKFTMVNYMSLGRDARIFLGYA
jgi:hypothetical protein